MKYSCDLIRDLIPLYIDGISSTTSSQMVEEHLSECAECKALLNKMKNQEVESIIKEEREDVISIQRKFFKRRSAVIGSIIAIIFMVPILVCLIINLASGSGLSWFFIVFSSMLVATSVSIVPLIIPTNKYLWTFTSFTISLLLLLGVCCIYTGGSWFFTASTSVLFGLSLVFLPFLVKSKVLPSIIRNHKGVTVISLDTLFFIIMMLSIGLHSKAPRFFQIAIPVSIPLILLAWALFFIIRYITQNYKIKAANSSTSAKPSTMANVKTNLRDKRKLSTWEIILLILGSPIWVSLLITVLIIIFSVYIAIWAVIISIWAAEFGIIMGSLAGFITSIYAFTQGNGLLGVTLLCAILVLSGVSIILFFSFKVVTKATVKLSRNIIVWIKSLFVKRREI